MTEPASSPATSTRSWVLARLPLRPSPVWFAAVLMLALVTTLLTLRLLSPEPSLRVGINNWLGYTPMLLARQQDLMGTQVVISEFLSTTEVMRALENGALDAAAVTLDEAIHLATHGVPITVVAVLDISNGADALVAHPRYVRLNDLNGARIAVENTALGGYVLSRVLEKGGLKRDQVHVVPMTVPEQLAAWSEGRIDAAITFEPQLSALRLAGAYTLFDSRQIPDEIVDLLVLRQDRMEALTAPLDALLRGWFATLVQIERDPTVLLGVLPPSDLSEVDRRREFLNTLAGLRFVPPPLNGDLIGDRHSALHAAHERLTRVMVDQRLISHSPEHGILRFDASALERYMQHQSAGAQ